MRNQKGSVGTILIAITLLVIIGLGLYVAYLTQRKSAYYRSLQQDAINKKIQYDINVANSLAYPSSETK